MKGFEVPPPQEKSELEQKKDLLVGLKARLEDLRQWQNQWTVEDRNLADRLEDEIQRLEKETGGLSGILDKLGV